MSTYIDRGPDICFERCSKKREIFSSPLQLFPLSFTSIQFSHSVVSDCLWPHEPQCARPPCPSLTPRVDTNSWPLCCWHLLTTHPLLSPSPPALNLSEHLCLFKWVSSSYNVAQVLEFQLQHQSFQWTPRTDLL